MHRARTGGLQATDRLPAKRPAAGGDPPQILEAFRLPATVPWTRPSWKSTGAAPMLAPAGEWRA